MDLPLGDQRNDCTLFSSLVSFSASPPSYGMTQTWTPLSRSARKAMYEPSGDHCGADSPLSPVVSLVVGPPSAETSQMCETRRVSFFIPFRNRVGDAFAVGRKFRRADQFDRQRVLDRHSLIAKGGNGGELA